MPIMIIQMIVTLGISLLFAVIIFFLQKTKNNIIKYAKFKYFLMGIGFLLMGFIMAALCVSVLYFIYADAPNSGEKHISADTNVINFIQYMVFITIILSVIFCKKGISSINAVYIKDKIIGTPEKMEFPLNVSRLKFLYASILNPFEMSAGTAWAVYILLFSFLLFTFLDCSNIEKVMILIIGALIKLAISIFALIQLNKLYSVMKKGNIYTVVSEQGVSRTTSENMIIQTTPWDKVEAVKFFKDYVAVLSKNSDYWIFTKNEAERTNIKLFYLQSRTYGNLADKNEASFEEIEEQLKSRVFSTVIFTVDDKVKLYPYSSKRGGAPFVPENFAYEYPAYFSDDDEKRPFIFLAQINCKEAYKFDKTGLLPKAGMLYFFCDLESNLGHVYYYNGDLTCLKELEMPENVPFIGAEYGVKISSELSLPCYEDFALMMNNGYFYDVNTYYTVLNSVSEELKITKEYDYKSMQMLGYPDLIYESVLESAIIDDNHLQITAADVDEISKRTSDWLLLFQISLEEEDRCFGRCFFYIKRDDLANRNFDKIYFDFQEY